MTDGELKELYKTACRGKGFEPNDGQFKIWKQTLGWCDQPDLAQALAWWFTDESKFPMPAELKPLIYRASQEREARAGVKKYLVVWICRTCGHRRSGFLAIDDRGARFCSSKWGPLLPIDAPRINGQRPERVQFADGQTCGAELEIVMDDRLVTA